MDTRSIISIMVRIASFDIGRCNFAQYIEEFDSEVINELKTKYSELPKNKQRRVKGEMNEDISEILNKIVLSGKRISTGVYNFTKSNDQGLDKNTRLELLNHLSKFKYIWDDCDIFIIEQQFFNTPGFGRTSAGSGANIDAIKMGESTYMWLLDRYPEKEITYFGSQFKTQIFGAPWKQTKLERKNWAVQKAIEIYNKRQDQEMITLFNLAEDIKGKRLTTLEKNIDEYKEKYLCEDDDTKDLFNKIILEKQKLDDISDSMIQCQAYKYRKMVACF